MVKESARQTVLARLRNLQVRFSVHYEYCGKARCSDVFVPRGGLFLRKTDLGKQHSKKLGVLLPTVTCTVGMRHEPGGPEAKR